MIPRPRLSGPLVVLGLVALLAGAASADTVPVVTAGFAFDPSPVTIQPGDTVDFTLGIGHNVVQTDGDGSCTALPGGFMSGASEIDTSVRSYQLTLTEPGTYYYKCNPHCGLGMRGVIVVEAAVPAPERFEDMPWGRVKGEYR
jgi:plastocyanin